VSAMCARVRAHLEGPDGTGNGSGNDTPKRTVVRHLVEVRVFSNDGTPVPEAGVADALANFGRVIRLGDEPGDSEIKNKKERRSRKARGPTIRYYVDTEQDDVDLLSELAFIVPMDQMRIVKKLTLTTDAAGQIGTEHGEPPLLPALKPEESFGIFEGSPGSDPGFGFFEDLPASAKAPDRSQNGGETSIRVAVEKVDALINLVGELVITQAMLAQNAATLDPVRDERLLQGLMQLDRNTRALQEAVMSVRMTPIGIVFNRFPRVVRDIAARLNKQVHLEMEGEATELDKGLIERLVDPLTHLVRNSLDHGLEVPERRLAQGKTAAGTIRLRAFHRGGTIVIEVSDDGAGLDRERILAKARERGISAPDSMSDAEVWSLIFEAGFSTANEVTDVSGRGVGMDVVRRNVSGMNGSIDIQSVAGTGTTIAIRLPLTLAIMDGMSVGVGSETYILPLASVVESLQVGVDQIHPVANRGLVAHVRGEYLPVISMHEMFPTGGARSERASGIMVIVEIDKKKAALLVDELLGQHQVVVKSLDRNYRRVRGVSGATIMGDGRVAIILDVAALVRPRLS